MDLNDSIYIDIDIYSYYTILISKITINDKEWEIITCICENLYDTTYFLKKYKCEYFYRISNNDFTNSKNISLIKYTNNNDYNIYYNKIEKDYDTIDIGESLYIIYSLVSKNIKPHKIFKKKRDALDFIYKTRRSFYLAVLKINKKYTHFYKYEYYGYFEYS